MEFKKITDLLNTNYYAIPDYQRDYAWKNQQNAVLIDDIFDLMRGRTKEHFIGAIVTTEFEPGNDTGKAIDFNDYNITKDVVRHVVDGQQRLTSLSLLFYALQESINDEDDMEERTKQNLSARLNAALRSNQDFHNKTSEAAPRLILNGNTGKYYNNDILGIDPDDGGDRRFVGAKRLSAALDFFYDRIWEEKEEYLDSGDGTVESFYTNLVDTLMKKVKLVEIQCSSSMDAFQVFDSLNGKGLDLTAADRVKNIFIHWCPVKNKGKQKWDAFVSAVGEDYLTNFFVALFFYEKKGGRVSKSEIPNIFKDYNDVALSNFDSFYTSLKRDGEIYGDLRRSEDNPFNSIHSQIQDLRKLNLDQVFVLIFAVCKHYPKQTIAVFRKRRTKQSERKDFDDFLKALTSLVVRMQVCDISTNRLDSFFESCIKQMEKKSTLRVIINTIEREKEKIVPDKAFQAGFETFAPVSNTISEYYLRHLEKHLRKKAGNNNDVERGLSVEHIIPQDLPDLKDWYGKRKIPEEIESNFKEEVVDSIGNKALLYVPENSAASNKNYNKKKDVYINGTQGPDNSIPKETFELIKEVLDDYPDKFDHTEVFDRAETLAEYALEIWK